MLHFLIDAFCMVVGTLGSRDIRLTPIIDRLAHRNSSLHMEPNDRRFLVSQSMGKPSVLTTNPQSERGNDDVKGTLVRDRVSVNSEGSTSEGRVGSFS